MFHKTGLNFVSSFAFWVFTNKQFVAVKKKCPCTRERFKATYLRVIPVGLVQDFHDYSLVYGSIVSQLLTHPFEDLGKCPLAQTLHLI